VTAGGAGVRDCSGEIFAWDGTAQSVLLETGLNIASFGEDEAGELYVVGLGGTVHRIVGSTVCTCAIDPPNDTFPSSGGTDTVAVTAGDGCSWTATSGASWITVTGGASGRGNGTVTYAVTPYGGPPRSRTGTVVIAGQAFTVKQSK
jgi:hypothetical protein